MSLSCKTRFLVLRRDGFRCRYCGRPAPDVVLHVDHVIARANGGGDDDANLVTACRECNLGKRTGSAFDIDSLIDRWIADQEHSINVVATNYGYMPQPNVVPEFRSLDSYLDFHFLKATPGIRGGRA